MNPLLVWCFLGALSLPVWWKIGELGESRVVYLSEVIMYAVAALFIIAFGGFSLAIVLFVWGVTALEEHDVIIWRKKR